jgi:hypothetical protein
MRHGLSARHQVEGSVRSELTNADAQPILAPPRVVLVRRPTIDELPESLANIVRRVREDQVDRTIRDHRVQRDSHIAQNNDVTIALERSLSSHRNLLSNERCWRRTMEGILHVTRKKDQVDANRERWGLGTEV